jgi:tRNA-intron endonuclease
LEESKQETEAEASHATELVKVKASLKEKGILVSDKEGIESLSTRGYGVPENGNLLLAFFEALFLVSKEILEVFDEKTGKTIGFQDILERFQLTDNDAWVKYLVYRDLRSRGYVVREGFGLGIDFRVYERGEYGKEIATYLIFVIQEGQPVLIEELARALSYVLNLKKKLVLAVINRRGEIVYYSVSQFTLSENL